MFFSALDFRSRALQTRKRTISKFDEHSNVFLGCFSFVFCVCMAAAAENETWKNMDKYWQGRQFQHVRLFAGSAKKRS